MDDSKVISSDIDRLSLAQSYTWLPEETEIYIKNKNKLFKVLHVNIRSINCNFNELLILLNRLSYKPVIMVLTECWLSKSPFIPTVNGYSLYNSTYCNQNDGVVVYTKGELKCMVLAYDIHDSNSIVLKISDHIAIVALYRSPSYKKIDAFLNSFDHTLNLQKIFQIIVLVGDININIIPGGKDPFFLLTQGKSS